MALLFLSQGVPMLSMGDELDRTQLGNNNAYCHDEEWNWLDWSPERDPGSNGAGLKRFVSLMADFRRRHSQLRRKEYFTGTDVQGCGYPDIGWHGIQPRQPDWGADSRSLAFMIAGDMGQSFGPEADFIYAAFNMWHEPLTFHLPVLPSGMRWRLVVDTARPSPDDFLEFGSEQLIADQSMVTLTDRSVIILVGNRMGRLG
jgi:glycogen operon protein